MNALREYYDSLPDPKAELKKKLLKATGRDETTITRWINGTKPNSKVERQIISQITGLTLKQLGYEK